MTALSIMHSALMLELKQCHKYTQTLATPAPGLGTKRTLCATTGSIPHFAQPAVQETPATEETSKSAVIDQSENCYVRPNPKPT